MNIKSFLLVILTSCSIVLFSQENKGINNSDEMLVEFYGEAEYKRKKECCSKQVDRNIYIIENSYKLVKKVKSDEHEVNVINEIIFTPKDRESYSKDVNEIIELIKNKKFNILISDISIQKDEDQFFKLEDSGYYLMVFSEAAIVKQFISTTK